MAVVAVLAACLAMDLPAQDRDELLRKEVTARDFFRIESHGAREGDVELTEELLCTTIVRLRAMFGVERVDRALRGIDCVVHLHGKATANVTESQAELSTGTRGGQYAASIAILAPTAFASGYRNAAGKGPGREHHGKVLAHEYATVLLDRIAAAKPAGWRFFAAPAWFVQGYEEYLAVAVMDAPARAEVLDAYVGVQESPDRVRFHPQLAVKDAYVDGAVFLSFLHESFGGERVRAVLDAPQPAFDEALTTALGASWKEVEARWKAWRDEALVRQDWRAVLRAAKSPGEVAAAVVGRDLRGLPVELRDTVFEALRKLAGKETYWRRPWDGTPHRLYRVDCGAARWALVVSYSDSGLIPASASWMAVHLFDREWQQTAVTSFPTGYRIALLDVWQERTASLFDPAIVVRLGSIGAYGNTTYRERQYYAVREDRVALVRKEEEGKEATRADFTASHPGSGPPPPARSAAQWIDLLASADPADVLEALTWLAGHHLARREPRLPSVNQESVLDSQIWEEVRDDPRTKEKVAALAKSTNRWLREAAVLASTPAPR